MVGTRRNSHSRRADVGLTSNISKARRQPSSRSSRGSFKVGGSFSASLRLRYRRSASLLAPSRADAYTSSRLRHRPEAVWEVGPGVASERYTSSFPKAPARRPVQDRPMAQTPQPVRPGIEPIPVALPADQGELWS
jgi:hypothetical protein